MTTDRQKMKSAEEESGRMDHKISNLLLMLQNCINLIVSPHVLASNIWGVCDGLKCGETWWGKGWPEFQVLYFHFSCPAKTKKKLPRKNSVHAHTQITLFTLFKIIPLISQLYSQRSADQTKPPRKRYFRKNNIRKVRVWTKKRRVKKAKKKKRQKKPWSWSE